MLAAQASPRRHSMKKRGTTMEVESADLHAPAGSGTRASFLIHSPARTLCVGDIQLGRRFRFEIERQTMNGQIRWSRFSGREIT
jgi:hypothetical protein